MSVGFGQDTWCVDAIQPGRVARGKAVVAQGVVRRVNTPRGELFRWIVNDDGEIEILPGTEESAYGLDLSGYVGAVGYPAAARALPSIVRGEILKDDRLSPNTDVTAELVTLSGAGGDFQELRILISAELADASDTFELTLGVTALTTRVLGGLP